MFDPLARARTHIGERFTNKQGREAEIVGVRRREGKSGNARFIIRFTESGETFVALYRNLKAKTFKDYSVPSVYGVGVSYRGAKDSPLYKTWAHMLERCFQPREVDYSRYKGRGVTVCDRWLVFRNFEADAKILPNYHHFLANRNQYSIDKDILGTGLLYAPNLCMFATPAQQTNAQERVKPIKAIDRNGNETVFSSKHQACVALGVQNANLYKVLNGARKHTQGYRFIEIG